MSNTPSPRLRLRVHFGPTMLGPGKADLLELIDETGSISAAGRAMKMSYKRAWTLVDEMNSAYRAPLVISARGGPEGGGAHLSETGREVLTLYRAMMARVETAAEPDIRALSALLARR
ncbi:winged helix-turn-helix domain-containing protein [Cognatishimia sp. MH4019]|uniref:winged helix-turn-helix domain-containing protein n=1 Tax=Cognatishimia sp. MH4019 TaxID=2854030 RepID=UPI001CD49A53|nr:winged helix-turn-helix domain-containing protein [Cognatishimia sp. MH4019]